ncbi:MAG: NUDIX domain-containing protein [Clostridia bacterium]|nr:NUDIX domain-containing protein [Clostridia bacterium]
MLVRNCAGGVVFSGNRVLLLKDENGEWVLPKKVIRGDDLANEVLLRSVKEEAGLSAEIISTLGSTNYEYIYVTRQKPVCNKITWYIMKSLEEDKIDKEESYADKCFFDVEEAMNRIACSQDKSLLSLSFNKLKEMV